MLRTCIHPQGSFIVGKHSPSYTVTNLRQQDVLLTLGLDSQGQPVSNQDNFPEGNIEVPSAKRIYEIMNPLPCKGATFIDSGWADARAADPSLITISPPQPCSLQKILAGHLDTETLLAVVKKLPKALLYDLAGNSTDPEELSLLAQCAGDFILGSKGQPTGLAYTENARPQIYDFELFETVANNPFLPDTYKEVMVLRPGAQGKSEVVGDYHQGESHVFEYLRTNSYIPWGHYAANFAHDSIRYAIESLSREDMRATRHLYYQRIYALMAEQSGLDLPKKVLDMPGPAWSQHDLEELRKKILTTTNYSQGNDEQCTPPATLWGWNFGYDFSGSGYRLHASHQMIHQQYAMVPGTVETGNALQVPAFSCGDMVADCIDRYQEVYKADFFTDYLRCIENNQRTDGQDGEHSLLVWQDENVILFVPKAQTSQWELQLMVIADTVSEATELSRPVGNILEASTAVRESLDSGILMAQKVLAGLGAKLVTSIEYSKRIGHDNGQRLLYAFLPKLPWSMGAFSEAQQRYICGHYPEDFALACRKQVQSRVQ